MNLKSTLTGTVSTLFNKAGLSLTHSSTLPKANLESFFKLVSRCGFKPSHILDIGANRAGWSGEASLYFPDARYTLVEPQLEMAEFIEPFCARRADSEWIRAGAAAETGEREFVVDPATVGSSFYIREQDRTPQHQVRTVPVVTLDSIVARRGIPELLKIDAEGAECEILRGGASVLGKTEVILLELSFFRFHPDVPTFSEMIAYMAERGYEPYHFTWFHPRPHDGALGLSELAFARRDGSLRAHHGWE